MNKWNVVGLIILLVPMNSCTLWMECNTETSDPPTKCFNYPKGPTAYEMANMNMDELVRSNGYPLEAHRVKSKDGYILTLFRIPHGRTDNGSSVTMAKRTPVLLTTSIFSSSTSYCLGSVETIQTKPFAFRLADEGFDVWLSNIRGMSYSSEHVSLQSDSKEFWDFNLQETGSLDHSAEIDHILQSSGHDDLLYFGFSRGASEYLILLSDQPEYNAKIRAGFLMSPVALNMNCRGGISCHGFDLEMSLKLKENAVKQGKYSTRLSEISTSEWTGSLVEGFCQIGWTVTNNVCFFVLHSLFYYLPNPWKINTNMVPVYVNNLKEETSLDSLVHFLQQPNYMDTFTRYDYGPVKNQEVYGQTSPGVYDLSLITVPTSIFLGDYEHLSNLAGAEMLQDQMANVTKIKVYKDWSHTLFFLPPIAYNAYSDIIKAMKNA